MVKYDQSKDKYMQHYTGNKPRECCNCHQLKHSVEAVRIKGGDYKLLCNDCIVVKA